MSDKFTPEERAILDSWPTPTEADIEVMNDLFSHYIFFRREPGAVRLWASCCGRTERLEYVRRAEFPWESELLDSLVHNHGYTCPWCGRDVTLKDLRKAGERKNLVEIHCALLLHSEEDALYADAVALYKAYKTEQDLTAKPEYWLSNDRGQESPLVTHKEFFDAWLAWLKAGSRRDKDGKPILPRKRKAAA